MTGKLEDFIKDPLITENLLNPDNKLIMVLGGADTGKTTMVECIVDLLAKYTMVGVVDTDMGQSNVGPPTTIAWAKIDREFKDWSDIEMEDFYFTGAITPFGNLVPSIVGAKLMTDKAVSCCEKVVVNTTGLIAEPAGRVLKQFKIDILSPDIILALEFSKELSHILDSYKLSKSPKIYRLPAPVHARPKGIIKRGRYRVERIKSYFEGSSTVEISLDGIGIRYTREPVGMEIGELKNRILSFRDENSRDIALGILEEIKATEQKLIIRTPLSSDARVTSIMIGRTEFDTETFLLRDVLSKRRE